MRLMAMLKWSMLLLLTLVVITPAAFADDWNPPSYRGPSYRGEELSVHATWNDLNWKSGEISQQPIFRFPDSMESVEGSNGRFNEDVPPAFVHLFGQSMSLGLSNFIDQEPLKKARIQLAGSWDKQPWWPTDENWGISGDPVEDWQVSGFAVNFSGNADSGLFQASTDFEIWPNPDWEVFSLSDIPAGVSIDQIVVDTISIPEPSTLTLAGLGTLLMGVYVLRRRRRS